MTLVATAMGLVGEGLTDAARDLVETAATRGDADALHLRGLWRIEGRLLARDLAVARTDFARAAAAGSLPAARVHSSFLAAGVGGARDWAAALEMLHEWSPRDPIAARQLELIAAMNLDAEGEAVSIVPRETLSDEPRIERLRGFLSAGECAFLIELATPRMKPALIFHEAQGRFVADPLRNSDAAGFPLFAELPAVHALNRRIARASATDVAQGETLQVLRYGPGQEYRPHLDAIAGVENQRILTMLVYLNDGYQGGGTRFVEADLVVRGRGGDGLLFANVLPDGRPDPASRHAGEAVTGGIKLLASRWIRARTPDHSDGFGKHEAERGSA